MPFFCTTTSEIKHYKFSGGGGWRGRVSKTATPHRFGGGNRLFAITQSDKEAVARSDEETIARKRKFFDAPNVGVLPKGRFRSRSIKGAI